jgi:hypothetical protein
MRDGRQREGRIVVPSAGEYQSGERITVYVVEGDPDRLSTTQGYTSGPAWRVQLAFILTGAGVLSVLIVLLRGGWSLAVATYRKAGVGRGKP